MLQKFGFTQYESKVFEALTASSAPLDASTIVKHSGVPKSKVYEVLNRLVEKGLLLTSFQQKKKLYCALPLETTIEKLTSEFESHIKDLKERKFSLPPGDEQVWSLKSKKSIDALLYNKIERAEHSIYVSGWSKDIGSLLPLLESKSTNGIDVEMLSVGAINSKLNQLHVLEPAEGHEALEQYQLIVIDEEDILFAGVEEGNWQGITTKSRPLVKCFIEFFQHDIALTTITKKYEQILMEDEDIKKLLMRLRY
ncbi:TrmB family transcriptional regulator [Halobacillus sp. A5]|uniref:TrmB family transcriptional regulator n=1 Tax=Halobacillus sp. A5 TaxID=2880263 RepID=UPI0020A66436|nr:helix-turn-helix domain-containing protein [Halobacillus sp. A5]MCP3028218.1 helix-turn-helix domain-containing protein [Halobacillus sp. A5]